MPIGRVYALHWFATAHFQPSGQSDLGSLFRKHCAHGLRRGWMHSYRNKAGQTGCPGRRLQTLRPCSPGNIARGTVNLNRSTDTLLSAKSHTRKDRHNLGQERRLRLDLISSHHLANRQLITLILVVETVKQNEVLRFVSNADADENHGAIINDYQRIRKLDHSRDLSYRGPGS